jgi:protein-tyrosine-phosphatase
MTETNAIPDRDRRALHRVVTDLHFKYQGVFAEATIEPLVFDSYAQIAAKASIKDWLVNTAERLTKDRLEALIRAENQSLKSLPAVLFLCTHNAGRSQMALGWFKHLCGDRAMAWSGGSEPEVELNKVAVLAMAEVGIDISDGFPKPWTAEVLAGSDVVVTMGCGDACPLVPGKHYEDWEVADPADQPLEVVRPIRDDLELRVRGLLVRLGVEVHGDAPA